jgi:deoxyribodipyrimidine photolyase-related protein
MSRRSRGIFHTRLSPLMNLHRLLPSRVLSEVLALDLPIASKEGFVRQLLGWREFVYRVHRATDGFRAGATVDEAPLASPGDGGYARWSGRVWTPKAPPPPGVDGGARPDALGADLPLPPAWWGRRSGLQCLDHVVGDVWEEGWSHHITRLMVLANLATLAGVSPRELCDWFWCAYIDSWDWVVEPNVLAMGTYAFTGMTTKPYVSGAAYLDKMGDSCRGCRFRPGVDCPVTPMYWSFLARNRDALCDNPRMKLPLASAARRTPAQVEADRAAFVATRDALSEGCPVDGAGPSAAASPGLWRTT